MNDSDSDSIVSTIVSEHDSDEEWSVSAILAEWPIDGLPRYLIDWENFDLCEATWEPAENLSGPLLEGWEKKKSRDDFDMFQIIRNWKHAVKTKYQAKLRRHNERNRHRRLRGEAETSFTEMEDHLKWANRFPDYEEPSDSAVSSPSVTTDNDMDVGVEQPLQPSFNKRQMSTASLSDGNSPISSRRNSATSVHQQTRPLMNSVSTPTGLSSTSSTTQKPPLRGQSSSSLIEKKKPPQKPVSSSTLSSKFGVRGLIKRTDSQIRKGQQTKARKTRPAQAFTGNVFSGGIVRKKRTTLAEAAKDSHKQPKLLKSRYQNIIRKAGRDKESTAPPRVPQDLISLNPAERSSGSLSTFPLRPERPKTLDKIVEPVRHDKKSAEVNQGAAKPKPRKSISWGTVEETIIPARGEGEFEREESIFLRDDSLVRSESSIPIKIEKIPREAGSSTDSHSASAFQTKASNNQERWAGSTPFMNVESNPFNKSIAIEVQFGPGTRETFSVVFERDQDQDGQPWSGIFEHHPILIFTHSCMTQDFGSQEAALVASQLGTGSVKSNGDATSLATVTSWLCVRSVGLLFYQQELCIFLYSVLQQDSVILKYYMFRPSAALTTRSLAPIVLPEGLGSGDVLPQMIPAVFNRLLGFQYESLLPERVLMDYSNHNFFLVFPSTAMQEADFLNGWLRSCNPQCRLLSSLTPGHWASFLKLNQGVVIVHEEAIWAIRLFPSVRNLLRNASNFNFRLFSISLQPTPLYPSLGQPCRIGDVTLQTICGQNKAVLVTPSFVVSQPQQAWAFFKWAYKYGKFHRYQFRLILCSEFESWLYQLAGEVQEDWEANSRRTRVRKEDIEEAQKEIEALYKCALMVSQITGSSDEALVFAPDTIDGNDEQSLVNWFGWWSILNLDQYRHFTILGSSSNTSVRRLTRQIEIPRYLLSTVGNPDEIYGRLNLAGPSLVPTQDQSAVGTTFQKRFQMVSYDDDVSFMRFLEELERGIRLSDWSPQTVFTSPVAYWNVDMAREFSNTRNAFETYDSCLRYFKERIDTSQGHNYYVNTGVAFCYTIEGSWKSGDNLAQMNQNRRPWIVVYRPVEPFRRPWHDMELLIWDPFRKTTPGQESDIYEGDLLQAQHEMIRVARGLYDARPLRRVWIRGLEESPQGLIDSVDITLQYLQLFMKDLKRHLPVTTRAMVARGWNIVQPGNVPIRRMSSSSTEPMNIDESSDFDELTDTNAMPDEGLKTVFHAPRGKNTDRPTKCKNRLFTHCTIKRSEGYKEETLDFIFRPTPEWYDEQVQEGRGFEHIRVMPWPIFFTKYAIEDPQLVGTGPETQARG
ncbi:hypothetical protein FBEOM_10595 [Fusarium beomiforme]|uniref:Chromo domain-containing protein n=1 Tax=Fusarium beomiforme TaxID=44412 RepID=A0A9P5AB92_9HYPO|nr:hypothetical protein FBEOM_10595 [Fusarium beomiforme]